MNQPKIFFSVGEPSGDLHAAKLIKELAQQMPGATFRGFGGSRMHDAGCQLDFELTNLAVMGFVEVLPKLKQFFRVADVASELFAREKPDAVVLVDFPGFNWHIARRAKQHNIPVIYYLPPQLWAWGGWRIRKMRRTVDHVICNLPFEYAWYKQRKISVEYVGHPFLDEVKQRTLDDRFLANWKSTELVQVAVLPGSRSREVAKIWPMQLAVIRELSKRYPRTQFLVAALRDQHCLWCQQQLSEEDRKLNIEFFVGKTSELIELADCSLMKSGSVSLEMMARGTPSVVVYHVGRAHFAIARCMTRIQSMTLPNMIAGRVIMPEFLAVGSTSATIGKAIDALERLIRDADERLRQRNELLELSRRIVPENQAGQSFASVSELAAHAIWKKLGQLRSPAATLARSA